MNVFNAENNERFRASTQRLFNPVLIPKRCACGQPVFAKQLTQYGACAACVKNKAQAAATAQASKQSPSGVANV
jgi:hypothetical protein